MSEARFINIGKRLPPAQPISDVPDWQQAQPSWIDNALGHALSLPSGGWFVLDASRSISEEPQHYRVAGGDYVVWRSNGKPIVAPDRCPHMGARLSDGFVRDGCVVCPWHGLALGDEAHGSWRPLPVFDDGVLVWVRPESKEAPTEKPILPARPDRYFDAVMRLEAACDPEDVVANRLDPWHGVHFHPHSFGRLKVIERDETTITVRVVYRIMNLLGMEVDARFSCPDPRTIVMTIIRGEGVGSVVETHATPIEPGRSAVIEATLAASDRPQFHSFFRAFGGLMRSTVEKRARRLWVEDGAYAERRYELRKNGR